MLSLLAKASVDADPTATGFQPAPLYVALAVLMPLALGLAISGLLWAAERLLGVGSNGGD